MKIFESELEIKTKGESDIVDITDEIERIISKTGIKNGIVNVFVPGSTGAVTTIEYEPGLLKDLPNALERIAPKNAYYEHEEMWHDGNGHSHVRASILGPSITIPVKNGGLRLGTWQQLVFIELDVKPRSRTLVVSCLGE